MSTKIEVQNHAFDMDLRNSKRLELMVEEIQGNIQPLSDCASTASTWQTSTAVSSFACVGSVISTGGGE